MGDTSGIFHILLLLYIYYRTYVGVCVTPFFFFFGVRCAQYKVHAQCSFAALAPHMPCMLLVINTSVDAGASLGASLRELTAAMHRFLRGDCQLNMSAACTQSDHGPQRTRPVDP